MEFRGCLSWLGRCRAVLGGVGCSQVHFSQAVSVKENTSSLPPAAASNVSLVSPPGYIGGGAGEEELGGGGIASRRLRIQSTRRKIRKVREMNKRGKKKK